MSDLSKKHCVPCEVGGKPLERTAAEALMGQIDGWTMGEDGKRIMRDFEFEDFVEAMTFVNDVADIAESEGHHPDIHLYWNKLKLELWTHAVGGLSENDFILASKINALL